MPFSGWEKDIFKRCNASNIIPRLLCEIGAHIISRLNLQISQTANKNINHTRINKIGDALNADLSKSILYIDLSSNLYLHLIHALNIKMNLTIGFLT